MELSILLDNAPIESFLSYLKSELIYLIDYKDPEEITTIINDYICFYKNKLVQIKNGISPVKYRTHTS
ncbi:IS3 family transposase [Paraclostridium sordellii]|uniref:IS3 family transposase n=1 Tax=Paraclostridium sordellii TaxID=1505 RepID=UPI00097C2C80